jgi:[ribosomal protein S5]-alanine N-acetyltransferase
MSGETPSMSVSDGVITLRPIADRDLDAIRRVFADPEWCRWFGPGHSAEDHIQRAGRDARDGSAAWFAICDAGRDDYLGEVGVRREELGRATVEYWLLPEGRRDGRATRAVRLVSIWAFNTMHVGRIQLWTEPENAASQAVAERSGYTREGVLREFDEIAGRRVDSVMFSLLPSDLAREAASRGPTGSGR